jgi:dTDP-glucose 4,6-dehydratase
MKLLVTGGAGFIGSNFIRYMLAKYPSYQIVNLDKLTYAGNLKNLDGVDGHPHYRFIKGDIVDAPLVGALAKDADVIINFAAESHVDRSIENPFAFIDTDVKGTYTLIEAAREAKHQRFIQISTDEVYGDREGKGKADESEALHAGSPYAASKAAADLLVLAAHRTYGFPGMITRCTNNYGPYQYPEKIIPLFITNALEDKPLPLYGDGQQIRDWLYVDDHCSAIDLVLHEGKAGEVYNIGAEQDPEITNVQLTRHILRLAGKPDALIQPFKDRPGHDRRYAVNSLKIRSLGWRPLTGFSEGIERTVAWYRSHEDWWKEIKSGAYREWYLKQYGHTSVRTGAARQ